MCKSLVGDTPMIKIDYTYNDVPGSVYAKLEYYNFSGSIKDRIAQRIVSLAEKSGALKPGQPIVEMTSGNTGIAFAALGTRLKHPVHIFMPDWASVERIKLMEMYGATMHLISAEEGGFEGALKYASEFAADTGAFEPLQFENCQNPLAHYFGTGAEILRQLPSVTDFVAGVGSGGTLIGVARRLKASGRVNACAVEPDAVPLLSGGEIKGPHRIEGIGDSFIPPIIDRKLIDKVYDIYDMDAVAMSSMLARELGLGVGISSGANFLASVLQQGGDPDKRVVTVFSDDNKKYLSTVLSSRPEVTESMITYGIRLLGFSEVTG